MHIIIDGIKSFLHIYKNKCLWSSSKDWDWELKLIWLGTDSLLRNLVFCYEEQTWIQIKKDDLAETSVLFLLHAMCPI